MNRIIFNYTILFLMFVVTLCLADELILEEEQPFTKPPNEERAYYRFSDRSSTFNWESMYQYYNKNSSLNNQYRFFWVTDSESDKSDWDVSHKGNFGNSRNKRVNRNSYYRDFNWNVANNQSILSSAFKYALDFNYNKAADKAHTEESFYELSKTRRSAGLNISSFSSGYSLPEDDANKSEGYLAEEQSINYALHSEIHYVSSEELSQTHNQDHQTIASDGYRVRSDINFSRLIPQTAISLNANFEELNIDNDYLRNYGLSGEILFAEPDLRADFIFNKQTRKIYLLQDRVDTHVRSNYVTNLLYHRLLAEGMKVSLGNRFNVRDNRLNNLKNRNYLEVENDVTLQASYNVWRLRFFSRSANKHFSRVFKGDVGNRYQKQNRVLTGLTFRVGRSDSLTVSRDISLTQTDYIVGSSNLDNDRLLDEYQVSSYQLFRERMSLVNHFNYSSREEIFLDSQMSGNNKVIRTYNLLPTVDIRLNQNLRFRQDYHLRADYDEHSFDWEMKPADRMYRKFSASYSLLTYFQLGSSRASKDDYLIVSPFSSDIKDMNDHSIVYAQGNLITVRDIMIGLRYIYDTNNSGSLNQDDKYEIYSENEYHTFDVDFNSRFDRIGLGLRPRFIWSNQRYEYNHLFRFSYQLPKSMGSSSLIVNPTGSNFNDIIWRINFTVNFEL